MVFCLRNSGTGTHLDLFAGNLAKRRYAVSHARGEEADAGVNAEEAQSGGRQLVLVAEYFRVRG